ncbi:MAG: hydrogenase maturation nickel metallochaperone HypA [Longimicrobiales bacterium]|nr:hydrogenase maturation nickel metallochaperone HypA [Longimicrobiales bacterium]
MHEMSVAMEICRIAEDQVGRGALPRVREIGLVVGVESGLEPDNLVFCLEALLERPPFAGAKTSMELLPGDVLRVDYLDVEDERPPN